LKSEGWQAEAPAHGLQQCVIEHLKSEDSSLGTYDNRSIQDVSERRKGAEEPFAHHRQPHVRLLGPNGAGKSSLMRTVATLQDPDSGSIDLDGLNVLTQKDEVRRSWVICRRSSGVPKALLLRHAATPGGDERRHQQDGAQADGGGFLNQTNLWNERKKALSTSRWNEAALRIAQAARQPEADYRRRATAGLDPAERNRFLNLLSAIGSNMTVILSTTSSTMCASSVPAWPFISNGELLLEGAPAEALESCAERSGPRW